MPVLRVVEDERAHVVARRRERPPFEVAPDVRRARAQRARRRRSGRRAARRSRAAAPSGPSARSRGASPPGTAIGQPYARASAALPPMWSEWQCVLTSFASGRRRAPAATRAAPASAARASRSRSRSARGRRALFSRTLFADSQSRTNTCICGGSDGAAMRSLGASRRRSRRACQEIARPARRAPSSVGAARSMRRDPARRSGCGRRSARARISAPGSNGGSLDELQRRALGARVDLGHARAASRAGAADGTRAAPAPARASGRSGRPAPRASPSSSSVGLAVREPLVEDEPLVHVAAIRRRAAAPARAG